MSSVGCCDINNNIFIFYLSETICSRDSTCVSHISQQDHTPRNKPKVTYLCAEGHTNQEIIPTHDIFVYHTKAIKWM